MNYVPPVRDSDNVLVTGSDQSVTASWFDPNDPYNRGTVDLSGLGPPNEWWVNRALVQGHKKADPRGKGIGSRLLQKALQKAVELGATRVRVVPGGYEAGTLHLQRRFYEKNGFVRKNGERPGEEIWEWEPPVVAV